MSASSVIARNTPKGIGADGKADVPSAYLVKRLLLVNRLEKTADISDLVTSFTITQELSSPVVVINLKVRDTINFFEDFLLSGQERLFIKLRHITKHDEDRELDLEFKIKEYPNYVKSLKEPNIQEYNIIGISPFAYNSVLTRISRSVKGNPIDGITRIYKEDLHTRVTSRGTCTSVFDGIINIQSPMKAAEWLRSKAFDIDGGPFFVYSNISGVSGDEITISSLSELWSSRNETFKTYSYRQYLSNPAQTRAAYIENATRVLDMQSNIKLDKLNQATSGGFAGTTSVTDIATKTFSSMTFDYSTDTSIAKNRIDLKEVFSPSKGFKIGASSAPAQSLSDLSSASISNISTNTAANYGGNQNSSSGPIHDNINRAKSYLANYNAVSHQIIVYGDFSLGPGRKIAIKIPKTINVEEYLRNNPNSAPSDLDKSMSGDYIIDVVAHNFSGGIYTCKLKIIKDS